MVMLEGKQYSCDGCEGKAIQPWWCWRGSNTGVMVLEGKQCSCDGGAGKVIQPWWCWRGTNTVMMVVQGSEIQQHFNYEMKAKLGG